MTNPSYFKLFQVISTYSKPFIQAFYPSLLSKPFTMSLIHTLFAPENTIKTFTQKRKNKNRNNIRKIVYKSEELWSPINEWIESYRCQVCYQVMSRKEPSKIPQCINVCGHITCAKCIASSFFIELNPYCPVKDCNKCINPTIQKSIDDYESLTRTPIHYCGDSDCMWDCGILCCGCIDICRNKCVTF